MMSKDTTSTLIPTAVYTRHNDGGAAPTEVKFEPGPGPHTTNGKTTGPSDYVLNAGMVDKDASSKASDSNLGQLRAQLTTIQDKVNEFLTERMREASKEKGEEDGTDVDMEKLIGADDEEEED